MILKRGGKVTRIDDVVGVILFASLSCFLVVPSLGGRGFDPVAGFPLRFLLICCFCGKNLT